MYLYFACSNQTAILSICQDRRLLGSPGAEVVPVHGSDTGESHRRCWQRRFFILLLLHSRVGPALPIIPALRAVAGCAHEPLLHQREYFIRATSIPIAASLLIISFHPRGALGVGAGCWVCSEMMRCLCLTRYLWYQRRDILAFNVASEIFCAAPSLDKQQDGMVALAFLQCESSVLSLSLRETAWAVPRCVSHKPAGFSHSASPQCDADSFQQKTPL